MNKLTKKERTMLEELGMTEKEIEAHGDNIYAMFKQAAYEAFVYEMEGLAAESLRRCLQAVWRGENRSEHGFDRFISIP